VDVKPRWNKGSPLKFRNFVPVSDAGLDLEALYAAGDFVFGPNKPGLIQWQPLLQDSCLQFYIQNLDICCSVPL
jgi:hypothetical protein